MAGFIQNIIWNSVEGFVEAGTRTAGELAGNALIKAGDMVENGGRGVGNGLERRATAYGSSITGQSYKPSPKALPSTARKPVIKRSNSLPASSKFPTSKSTTNGTVKKANTSSTPLGQKKITNGASKPSIPPFKGASNGSLANKPFANSTGNLPAKKTAVKPGVSKPFVPPASDKKKSEAGKKGAAYPGQGSRVPVQAQRTKYKPMQRMGAQVGQGQQMNHIAI